MYCPHLLDLLEGENPKRGLDTVCSHVAVDGGGEGLCSLCEDVAYEVLDALVELRGGKRCIWIERERERERITVREVR